MSIEGVVTGIRRRELSVVEHVSAALDKINRIDKAGLIINSVATTADSALSQAAALDARVSSSAPELPLLGITVVVKDCIETADMPTAFGVAPLRGSEAPADAGVVTRLRRAGAIVLGKSTMPDLATSLFGHSTHTGRTKNPRNPNYDPGGSSSGSAAAVAAGLVDAAIGTDNGGSIRIPASFCGVVGVRATPGRISRSGTLPLVPLQDTVGPLAATVADAKAVFDALYGYDPADPLTWAANPRTHGSPTFDRSTLRFGILRQAFGSSSDRRCGSVNAVVDRAVEGLRAAGAVVVDEVIIPGLDEAVRAASMFMLLARSSLDEFLSSRTWLEVTSLEDLIDRYPPGDAPPVLSLIAEGPADPEQHPAYFRCRTLRDDLELRLAEAMGAADVDVLLYPSARWPAPSVAEVDAGGVDAFTFPSNALISSHSWMPAMTVSVGDTPGGLPVGCEILARRYDEATMFVAAAAVERVSSSI